jgi:hypothetical protein
MLMDAFGTWFVGRVFCFGESSPVGTAVAENECVGVLDDQGYVAHTWSASAVLVQSCQGGSRLYNLLYSPLLSPITLVEVGS